MLNSSIANSTMVVVINRYLKNHRGLKTYDNSNKSQTSLNFRFGSYVPHDIKSRNRDTFKRYQ